MYASAGSRKSIRVKSRSSSCMRTLRTCVHVRVTKRNASGNHNGPEEARHPEFPAREPRRERADNIARRLRLGDVARLCQGDVTRYTLGRARKAATSWPKPDLRSRKYNDPFVSRDGIKKPE